MRLNSYIMDGVPLKAHLCRSRKGRVALLVQGHDLPYRSLSDELVLNQIAERYINVGV